MILNVLNVLYSCNFTCNYLFSMKVYETIIRYGKILSTPKSKHIWLLGYNKVTIKNVENTKQQIFMLWRESLFFDQKWMKFNAIFFATNSSSCCKSKINNLWKTRCIYYNFLYSHTPSIYCLFIAFFFSSSWSRIRFGVLQSHRG